MFTETQDGRDADASDPPGADAELMSLIGIGEELLVTSIAVLRELAAEIRKGEQPAIKAFTSGHTELAKVLRQAVDTQRSYDDWRKRTSGVPAQGEIDFVAVRHSIRGKLDRLRSESEAGGVP